MTSLFRTERLIYITVERRFPAPGNIWLYPISCMEDCLLTFQAQGLKQLHYALNNFFVPDTPVQYQKKHMEIMAACGVDYFVFDTTEQTFAGSSLIDGYYFSKKDLRSEKRKRLEDLEKKMAVEYCLMAK